MIEKIKNGDSRQMSIEERKKILEKNHSKLQNEIHSDFDNIKDQVIHYGKYAILIGGAFVVTYYLVGKIFGSDDDSDSEHKVIYIQSADKENQVYAAQNHSSGVYQAIMNHIAAFLFSIAKEKLLHFIEELDNSETNKNL
jgi:hypothetical protein